MSSSRNTSLSNQIEKEQSFELSTTERTFRVDDEEMLVGFAHGQALKALR